ncbi:membrane anchor subunit of succinate dehydrogenase, Sdh4 [Elasticomyces elasticus]|nr:membrane anchor subunit of succinate dehydrogenase, Sdh4 [Elasticomyces elasticus]
MAGVLRPSLLRQSFLAAPTQRTCASSTLPTFRLSRPTQPAFVRSALPGAVRVAAFHATRPQAILPPLPQRIIGTINDAAKVPDPTPMHGSYHWTFERIMSAALVPLTIAPFATNSVAPALDAALIAGILIHSHIGFESIVIDYVPQNRLPGVRRILMWALKLAFVVVGVGFYEFETHDVGLTEGIRRLWKA